MCYFSSSYWQISKTRCCWCNVYFDLGMSVNLWFVFLSFIGYSHTITERSSEIRRWDQYFNSIFIVYWKTIFQYFIFNHPVCMLFSHCIQIKAKDANIITLIFGKYSPYKFCIVHVLQGVKETSVKFTPSKNFRFV